MLHDPPVFLQPTVRLKVTISEGLFFSSSHNTKNIMVSIVIVVLANAGTAMIMPDEPPHTYEVPAITGNPLTGGSPGISLFPDARSLVYPRQYPSITVSGTQNPILGPSSSSYTPRSYPTEIVNPLSGGVQNVVVTSSLPKLLQKGETNSFLPYPGTEQSSIQGSENIIITREQRPGFGPTTTFSPSTGYIPTTTFTPSTGYNPTSMNSGYTPTSMNSGYTPTSMNSGYTPTSMNSGYTPTSMNSGYTPTSMNSGYTPTSMNSGYTPTSLNSGFIPTTLNSGFTPTSMNSGYTPTSLNSGYTPTSLNSGFIPTTLNSGFTPTTINSGLTPTTTVNSGFSPTAINSGFTPTTINSGFFPTTTFTPGRSQVGLVNSGEPVAVNNAKVQLSVPSFGAPYTFLSIVIPGDLCSLLTQQHVTPLDSSSSVSSVYYKPGFANHHIFPTGYDNPLQYGLNPVSGQGGNNAPNSLESPTSGNSVYYKPGYANQPFLSGYEQPLQYTIPGQQSLPTISMYSNPIQVRGPTYGVKPSDIGLTAFRSLDNPEDSSPTSSPASGEAKSHEATSSGSPRTNSN